MDQNVAFPFEITPERVIFGFVVQNTTPSNFLQWLSKNEISENAKGFFKAYIGNQNVQ